MFSVIFLFFCIGASARDHLKFDTTIICNVEENDTYNLTIGWYEVDFFGADNMIDPVHYTPNTGNFSFTLSGIQQGDEAFSEGYKPRAVIHHNCFDNEEKHRLTLTVDRICEMEHDCHYRIINNITNKKGDFNIKPANFTYDDYSPFPDFTSDIH
ncbi:hypothetical protein GCK72_006326 [Caenorhabditis remanei]|uniref:Uncharacterized protein n=1 Tax=Caenorhabditis remanei TaxID=31234 RepID=A0A6A5HGE6_CAERE|nr:hypothetical protein GCK72_006326 [Caenorhabditis remanei]KAF1766369.1 hypothetical protein GCK72_006326 [Caenorhabditis remanei]